MRRTILLAVSCLLAIGVVAQQPQPQTIIIPVDCWSNQRFSGCSAVSGRNGAFTDDWTVYGTAASAPCSFTDSLPRGSKVTGVTARAYLMDYDNFDGTAQASVQLNGSPLGAPQSLTNGFSFCNGSSFRRYDFVGGPTLNYQVGTQNTLTVSSTSAMAVEAVDLDVTYLRPPPFDFEITDTTSESDRRILIAKHHSNYQYTSHFQNLRARDREVEIVVHVNDANGPLPGRTVYFRVADPEDKSPYVPQASRRVSDNADRDDQTSGRLTGTGVTAVAGTTNTVSVVSGANGTVRMILTVSDQHAGDNYQIEGSFDSTFACAPTCSKGGILTAWKRVYVEKDEMFRQGSVLAANAAAGQNVVRVRNRQAFGRNQTIRLIHAPFRDGSGPVTPNGVLDLSYWSEAATVARVDRDNAADNRGGGVLTLAAPLLNSYTVDGSLFARGQIDYLNDGVAVVNNNPALANYEVSTTYLQPTFNDAYVEYVVLNPLLGENVVPNVPHVDNLSPGEIGHFAAKWFENADHTPDPSGGLRSPLPFLNHRYLAGVSTQVDASRNNTAVLGTTFPTAGGNYSLIWVETIEAGCTQRRFINNQPLLIFGLNALRVNGETVVHELAHQFDPNPSTGEHCSAQVHSQHPSPNADCVMHSVSDQSSGDDVVAFHYLDNAGVINSEYITIRSRPEPLP